MIEMIKKQKKFNKFHVSILRKIELKRVKKCVFLYFELLFRQKFDSDRVQNIFFGFSACHFTNAREPNLRLKISFSEKSA
jgi:hypothetical protein